MKIDAVVEVALGVTLLAGFGASDFASPVGRPLVATVGVVLCLVGVAIWRVPVGLRYLAIGNAVTAGAALLWLMLAPGFSLAGTAFVASAASALAVLAAVQLATLRA